MIQGKTVGASCNFERGFTNQENWQRKFSFKMHKAAEQAMQAAIMENRCFNPVVVFVRNNGYLVMFAGDYTKNESTKDILANELHDSAKRPEIIGIIMVNDVRIRRSLDDPNFEDAIYTNSQWRDHENLTIVTKYVIKSDIETEFGSPEEPEYDLATGRFCNFFNK